jgi:uncharacterized protein
MSQQDVETLRGAYEAFNRGDIEAVTATMDPNIAWKEPGGGNAPEGTFTSPQSVAQDVFATVPQNFEEFSAAPEEFKDQGNAVVVTGRFHGKAKTGAILDASFEHVYEMKGGKVIGFENKVDREAWTAAWS